MESPDSIVDTSDVEEREILAVSIDIDHSGSSASTRVGANVHASSQTENGHQWHPDCLSATMIPHHNLSSDHEIESSSPRKRIKLAHNSGSVSPGFPHSMIAEASYTSARPPEVALINQIYTSPSKQSPGVWSQSMRSHSTSRQFPHSLSHSLSIPFDHDSLFSSPCRPTTPPQTSSQHSYNRPSSARWELYFGDSSPLTVTSSPVLPQTASSPDPIQLLSPRHPRTPSLPISRSTISPTIPHPVRSPSVEIPGDPQPLARYSLRRREARQLNPYAYDKLLYKQQLKSHPDAIVKFPSLRHRSGSLGAGEEGTQDEFVLPLDNPDKDGDYVGEGGGKRRRKTQSLGRKGELGEDDQVPEVRQGEGWLPEALKELSSSDEDDNKIRKLARKVRREREKAEAKSRAEARRVVAVAEARRKSAKRRPKPFPVQGNAEGEDAHFPEHIPPTEPSPSPSLLSRAQSEPAYPSSPARPFRPPTQPRVSSHSPTSRGPPRSPGCSVHLQQEDLYQFNDYDFSAPFLRNRSLVDHFTTYSAPPSPSGPPTTSGTSALPSNDSGVDSESDQSTIEMNSRDRKRLRALKRMMPAAMIARQLGITITSHPPRTRVIAESSGSEAEEARVIPGTARVRKGRYKDMDVRGDPESSDVERPTEVYDHDGKEDACPGAMEMLSDGQSAIRVRRTRRASPRPRRDDDVISLSDGSMLGSSSEHSGSSGGDDEKNHQSLFDYPTPTRGPARERSLIDWMLSRTNGSGRLKFRFKQSTGRRKPHGSGAPRLNIVTSTARRYGEQHQSLLPFVRANTSSNTTSSIKHSSEHRGRMVQLEDDAPGERKKKKPKSGINQGLVYSVHHDPTRITSKYREVKVGRRRAALVIEHDDTDFRRALDPGWRAEVERWNKPLSPARRPAAKLATSAPIAPRSHLHRRTSPRPQHEIPLPLYFQREEEASSFIQHHIIIDMNITPLPSGVKFRASSYVGKGLLYQLILVASGNSEVAQPISCDMQGFEVGPTTSASVFIALLGPLCDRLISALREFKADGADPMKEWESVTRASTQLLSWLAVHAEDKDFVALEVALREYSDGLLLALDSLETSIFTLTAHWFVVELGARLAVGVKYRRGFIEGGHLIRSAKQLMQHLLCVDLQPAFATFHAAEGDVDDTLLPHRAAELWICLIHLLPNFEISLETSPSHPLWHFLTDLHPESALTGTEASENMWRTIFSLCAISQFSVHGLSTSVFRLPAAWDLVAVALKKIILISNPEKDRQLPRRALEKRDEYMSYIVSRCFLLWKQWEWHLDDGITMFKSLQEIFRSRNFSNLLDEPSAPMGFLENGDLELLSKRDPQDTAFEVFLKMVVQAVNLLNANVDLDAKQRSVNIKKLLQMAVPVSPVPFSRSAPPSRHTLSMLVNRFSAMTLAIHLDPTTSNVKFRVGQARRCVYFIDADDRSRVACVYGMMNFAMIIKHHKIVGGLEEVLGWLGEMADVLMDEYKESRKVTTTTLIQLLIGSVRRVTETQSLDKGHKGVEYPDPALLDGPWITRVFNARTDLVTVQQTSVEIRMLVQSFLNARLNALPNVQSPPPPLVHRIESQESQDEYDRLYLDIKDEELLAALGEKAEASAVADLKSKEDALCKVLDKSIAPAVYRLVCKHFSENEHTKNDATSARAADEWIDCWVGCANVLVQNNYKDWGLYMKLGQQSWEKIINDSWRRRVGLRFNLTLLRLDPRAYNKMKDDFIAVLLIATLSYKITIEHEFMSLVLSLDGLQHPLLRGAPLDLVPETRKYEVHQADYEMVRGRLIETVFANTAVCLRASVDAESQGYAELVVMMLSTMRNIYEELAEGKVEYGEFCQRVFHMLSDHPELTSHPRISGGLGWSTHTISLG